MSFTRIIRSAVRLLVGAGHGDLNDDSPRARRRLRLWLAFSVAAVASVVAVTGAFGGAGSGTITTFAGTSRGFSGDGGPAIRAQLDLPRDVAVDGKGNVYIADYSNYRVRKVSPTGRISTFAGAVGVAGDLLFEGGGPHGLAFDRKGNLYISVENGFLLKATPNGALTTIAGVEPGTCQGTVEGCLGDGGPATSAFIDDPEGVAVDAQGAVYFADYALHRVRKVSPSGIISTIAGTGKLGFSGDGGPATQAQLYEPKGVAVDRKGNLYIADSSNNRVRKVSRGGKITTYAGTGKAGFSGDGGPATRAKMYAPWGLAVDTRGNLYITEGNTRVRKVSPSGKIATIAGGARATSSSSGDGGPATRAQLNFPKGVTVDRKGNIYIAEFGGYRVRKVRP